jgi:methylmalonyl-CoA/ethylmalonyl-CoA epimerase
MTFVRSLDHTSVAVGRIPVALPLFRDLLGGELVGGAEEGPFRWIQLRFPGGGKIELIDPSAPDSFVRRFLDTRGGGVHHITFKVDDLSAAVAAAEAAGFPVFGVNAYGDEWKEAFIHPRHAHGVLIQFAQSPYDEGVAGSPIQGDSAQQVIDSTPPPT